MLHRPAHPISRREVLMPGGIELTRIAETFVDLDPETKLLSIASGTGEMEAYLAGKHGCSIQGIDIDKQVVADANVKASRRGLGDRLSFSVGDGRKLPCVSRSYDVVFCSGALCAFFESGLRETHRVLRPGGRGIIIEVFWKKDHVPAEIEECWSEGTAHIQTLDGNGEAFARHGFRTIHAEGHDRPDWWEAYYKDRGESEHWKQERNNYRSHRDYLGVALFVIEKI
jgi:ubiquinone/menaquinone biosynthesis C-methylase UbiE